jgi:hypothetical protein
MDLAAAVLRELRILVDYQRHSAVIISMRADADREHADR